MPLRSRIRLVVKIPLLEPSKAGLTIQGSGTRASASVTADSSPSNRAQAGVATPEAATNRLAQSLSSVTASVSGSEPV